MSKLKELSREEAHQLRVEYKEGFELWHVDYEKQRDFHVKQFIEWIYNMGLKICGELKIAGKKD